MTTSENDEGAPFAVAGASRIRAEAMRMGRERETAAPADADTKKKKLVAEAWKRAMQDTAR
mgnify:FL=1